MGLTLLSVFVGGHSQAQSDVIDPLEPNNSLVSECESPSSLNNVKIMFATEPHFSPYDPFANILIEMDFSKKSYTFVELQTQQSFIGAYQYRKLAQNVGYVEGKDVIGAHILRYTILLVCKNSYEGRYIFSQAQAGDLSDINQNMGVYYIFPDKPSVFD